MNEEVKVMKDDRGVEYKCLTYTSRFTGETDVVFDIQQYMNNGNMYIGLGCNEEGYLRCFCLIRINLENFVRMDLQCMRRTKEAYQRISKKMKRGEKIGN